MSVGSKQHLAQGGQRDVVGPSVEELVLQQQHQGRRVLHRVAGLQGCVQDLEAVDVHRPSGWAGPAPGSAHQSAASPHRLAAL